MREILKSYEEQLRRIEQRITELRGMKEEHIPPPALNLLRARIDTLICEKYELMDSISKIRRYLEPKTPEGGRPGDAA